MATAATMKSLWSVIESMSLTSQNKKWLADKLIESTPVKREKASTPAKEAIARLSKEMGKTYNKEEQRILEGFYDAIQELKEIKAGRAQAIPHDIAMAQLKKELEEEGYEFD